MPCNPLTVAFKGIVGRTTSLMNAWQTSVCFWAYITGVTFVINLAALIWVNAGFPKSNNDYVLMEGDCSAVSKWDTGLHLVINAISVVLLSASNYTMQCLSSPTRSELDIAHAHGQWLDVGVPS